MAELGVPMLKSTLARVGLLVFATVLCLHLPQSPTWAQSAPAADVPPEKARRFLELLNDPEVKTWLEGKIPAAAEGPASSSFADAVASWEAAVHDRLAGLANAVSRVPDELSRAAEVASRDVNSGRPGLAVGILAVLFIVGFGAEWLVRRGLGRLRAPAAPDDVGQKFLFQLAALLTFALASAGSFLALEWPPLLRKIVLTLLLAFVAVRAVRMVAGLVVRQPRAGGSPAEEVTTPVTSPDAARFWLRRVSLIAGFFLFGWAIVSFMPQLSFSPDVTRLVAFTFGLGILATAVETVWRRPGSTASVAVRSLVTIYLIALWLAWVAGLLGLLWLGIYALLLRPAVHGAGEVAKVFADKAQRSGAFGIMLNVFIVRGARAAVIGVAVAWLAYIFRVRTAALAGSEAGALIISGIFNGIIILLVADLLWQLSKALIEYRLDITNQADTSPDETARRGRLRTLLPIFRNALAVFIVAVTALTILSGLGVKIAPLIAGAGIFGVAVGFGSQTLVKDILSGVFYMLDDAFRVGEYIQSGSYKGTVESFSLRSVRLRHHRGPVYTVPFGQLGAIQNMSRDWTIEKMTIGVTYDSDVELARKLIKKIGLELAKDPEFEADTIEPLKMQGIDNFGEYSIVLRMKLMTKPGMQFGIKMRAYMMIKKAFEENGIKIAFPTVHVEGGGEAAAASHEVVRRLHSDAAAAAEAKA